MNETTPPSGPERDSDTTASEPIDPLAEHPLAVWLHQVASNLDTIRVRDREADDLPWKMVPLAALPHPVAAAYIADFLQRWPFIPDGVGRKHERDN